MSDLKTNPRLFCFTDHFCNLELWKDWVNKHGIEYVYIGDETCPTTGKKHFQGYVYFKSEHTLKAVCKMFKGRHIEICNGTAGENLIYCSKEKLLWEYGIRPAQGTRNDIKQLHDLIREKKSDEEIFNNFPNAFIKYHKGIDRARTIFENNTRRNWEMEVRIYWGEPGTGKTRSAIEEFPDAYCKMKGKWWDHYKGEKCVIIDDFDPSNCFDFTFDFYLKLLDRYPLLIEYKGGSREFSSKVIIFTSNFNPDEWFEGKRNRNAFFRRVNVIKEFK